jgi:hypothetical protein
MTSAPSLPLTAILGRPKMHVRDGSSGGAGGALAPPTVAGQMETLLALLKIFAIDAH